MQGKWKVFRQTINGKDMYIAGKQRDMGKPLHAGNIEYTGEYTENVKEVEAMCESLNKGLDEKAKGITFGTKEDVPKVTPEALQEYSKLRNAQIARDKKMLAIQRTCLVSLDSVAEPVLWRKHHNNN